MWRWEGIVVRVYSNPCVKTCHLVGLWLIGLKKFLVNLFEIFETGFNVHLAKTSNLQPIPYFMVLFVGWMRDTLISNNSLLPHQVLNTFTISTNFSFGLCDKALIASHVMPTITTCINHPYQPSASPLINLYKERGLFLPCTPQQEVASFWTQQPLPKP